MARLWLGELRFLLSVTSRIVERMVMMSPVRTSRLYSSGDVERINFVSALDLAFDSDKSDSASNDAEPVSPTHHAAMLLWASSQASKKINK